MMKKIIEKLFCLHQMREINKVEVKDNKNDIIGIRSMLLCDICGKVKTSQIQ